MNELRDELDVGYTQSPAGSDMLWSNRVYMAERNEMHGLFEPGIVDAACFPPEQRARVHPNALKSCEVTVAFNAKKQAELRKGRYDIKAYPNM